MSFTRFITLVLLVFFIFNLSGCSDPNAKKVKHYKRALEYVKIHDSKAAIIELKNAIQIDAKFADARYQLGLLYLQEGNPQAAFGELQRTVSLDPKNLDAGVKVAEFNLLSHKKDECRKYVEQVLKVNPDYQDGLALLANLEMIEGNFTKAEEAINKALTQAPENDKFYNIKGRILIAQNKWEEGGKLFQKAISLNPDKFTNYQTMLMFYRQQKNEAAIQPLVDTMVAKFPDNPQMYLMLADLYQQKGDLELAEHSLLKLIKIKNESVPFRLILADFYKNHQLADKAETFLHTSLADFPDDVQLQVALAELNFDLQKFDQAKSIMEAVLADNPANGGAILIKARFLIKDGKNKEALELIAPLTSDYPKWPDPYFYTALTQLRLGKAELAQKAIETALKINGNNDRYHALAAQIQLTQGNSTEAGKEATLALRINQQNSIAVRILAKALLQAKKYDKAIDFIGKLNKEAVAGDVELLGSLGIAYLGLDNKEKARQTFADLLVLAPDNSKALALLTGLTFGKDFPGAIEFVKKQIALNETAGHYVLLGDLLTKNKQYEEALQAYEKVQKLTPNDPQGYVLSARLLSYLGRTDQTKAQYEELLKTDPDSIPGLMGLATTYEVQGKLTEAKIKYARALEIQPGLPAAANNLAWLLASEDGADLGEALRLAMQAKQAFPNQANIADTLGWVHYKRKSYSLAIAQFKLALDNRPEDQTIQYHLALALYDNGDKQEAVEVLGKALAEDGKFDDREKAEGLLKQWTGEVAGVSAQ